MASFYFTFFLTAFFTDWSFSFLLFYIQREEKMLEEVIKRVSTRNEYHTEKSSDGTKVRSRPNQTNSIV